MRTVPLPASTISDLCYAPGSPCRAASAQVEDKAREDEAEAPNECRWRDENKTFREVVQKKKLHNTRASHVVPHRSTGRA
eukprot:scaffold846_cov252-Pinguiococcus_pyrenoidosus.AAC.35